MLTVQWLQVMEFSVFPLTLWLGGRYRHAFAHLCRQIFCCDDSACEEQNTCKLQSYRLKAHIREQRQKAVEAMEAKIAQAKGRGPVMVKGLSLTALANEPEGTSPQHESTVTEVQADVHAQSTPASRRSSTFQPGPVVRNSGPRISKGSPMVQRFAPTLKEEAASTTNATPLVNLVRPTPKPIEIGNTNNNNIAGAGEIRSKLSSPAISESESKITTLELYDDEDIDAGLDASPLPKEPPAEGRKPEAIEMRNVEREKCSQQSSATPDVGVTSRGNDEDKMLTSKKPAVFPKPQPKAEVKIWTSQSKTPPNAPSGISFDCQGGTGPYFEPVSDSSSVTSDEVSQPNILQAEHLSKSKTPYTRSESFLQAVSSSSAYGTISPKPASKFKLLTKIALKLRNLSVRSKQTKSDKLSDEGCKQSDSEGILDKFACGSDEKPGEAIQRCTLKDRPALDPNTKQFHVTDDDLASHEIIRKLRNYDSEDTEEEFPDASSTTDDTRPFAAKKQKTKKNTPVTSKKSSKDNLGKELVASTAGVTNMAADLTDSPVKKPISTEVLAEHKIVKKLQFQSSSDGLAETPPTDAGDTGADGKQGKKKKTGAVGGSRSPQVPKRILPPKVIKKPIPPPPPPPPPLPPPKGHQYPGGMARINNTSESSRSVKSEASSVSVTGDESRFLRAGSEGQKRSSLITSDLLASHEIIKRLQNQAEKNSEPLRRPYTRVNLAPAKPLLPPPPLPPTPPLSKPTRATLAKPDTTGLVPSAVDSSGSGLGEQNTSGTEDEKPLIEVLSHTSSGRIYRSVSSESIFSHMENENKEFPSSLSKATDDLRVSHLSNPSSTALTLVSVGWLTDTRPDIFPTNLKDTNRCSRSTSDISASGHHSSYRPPVPPRTIPVQKVKSLQATMMEREQSSSPYSETSIRLQEAQNLSTEDQKMVKDKKADESTNTVALKDEPPRSLKILKKIEEELDSETSAKLRKDLGNVDTLKRSPVFMRRFHQELVARKLSDESTKSVFMPATKLKNSLTAAKDTPSSSNSKKINDGSSTALRKFLSEAVTERRLSEQSSVSSTSSSPIKTIEQDSGDKDSPPNNAEDKGHVDIKAAV